MYKQQEYSNAQESDKLADVISCTKRGDHIRIKYEILFHKGKYKGETKILFADLEDIECDDLPGYLIEQNYLTEYTNQEDYFDIINREVFIADWTRKLFCI